MSRDFRKPTPYQIFIPHPNTYSIGKNFTVTTSTVSLVYLSLKKIINVFQEQYSLFLELGENVLSFDSEQAAKQKCLRRQSEEEGATANAPSSPTFLSCI